MDHGTCFECPAQGTDCAQAGASLDRLPIQAEWWRPGKRFANVSLCYTAGACLGGTDVSAYCAMGHTGAWCDGCQVGWYHTADSTCKACGDVHLTPQGGVIFALLGIAALALAMYTIHRVRKDQLGREDTVTANCSRWVQKVQRIYDKLKEGVGNK